MEKKHKEMNEAIWLAILVILFVNNAIKFFVEGDNRNSVALILFYLILILALILALFNKKKLIKNKLVLLNQTKLDQYFISTKDKNLLLTIPLNLILYLIFLFFLVIYSNFFNLSSISSIIVSELSSATSSSILLFLPFK